MRGADYAAGLLAVIAAPDDQTKAAALDRLQAPDGPWTVPAVPTRPGRPAGLREADKPARRRKGIDDPHGRRRFLHAIWHIELSAVDLACLLCLRAPEMPAAFHIDHLGVARDEADHAALLAGWLRDHDYAPGSEAVHFRLWDTACAAIDVGEQLVVIPRFLEARGLDVTAPLLPRLAACDPAAHTVVERIYYDEIRHVSIGTRWHRHWCREQGLDPLAHFTAVSRRHFDDQIPGAIPLDRAGRGEAGFWPAELAFLAGEDGHQGPDEASRGVHPKGVRDG